MREKQPVILSIESSCDDTSAAVLRGLEVLSNVVCSQQIHEKFGRQVQVYHVWYLFWSFETPGS